MANLGIIATVKQHTVNETDGPPVVLEPLPHRGTGHYRLTWTWRGKRQHRYFHTNDPNLAAYERDRAACALAAGNRPKTVPPWKCRTLHY